MKPDGRVRSDAVWDPAKHPRAPAGSPEGGEFAETNAIEWAHEAAYQRSKRMDATHESAMATADRLVSEHASEWIAKGKDKALWLAHIEAMHSSSKYRPVPSPMNGLAIKSIHWWTVGESERAEWEIP